MKDTNALECIRKEMAEREKGYRARALKLFPHVCASCGREFSGPKLKQLTVHHKDHNHQNNPNDGSNWELLCVYCHDHEHEKYRMKGHGGSSDDSVKLGGFSAFDQLDGLFSGHIADENKN
jgi:5-methylcytosine-specific restriction endonuclease McrA